MSVAPATIARVFKDVAFRSGQTRVSAAAVALSEEYIRLFIQEAVLRANAERLQDQPTHIDGIDNVAEANAVADDSDQFRDTSMDEPEERGLGVPTQWPPEVGNDVLDSRHLAAVSGLLVMDF